VVLPGCVAVDLPREEIHALIQFVPILDVLIAQDIEEVHELHELIPLDDAILDDRHLLHPNVDEDVPFPKDAHREVTIHRDDLRADGADPPVVAAEGADVPTGNGVDLREDVVELIRIGDGADLAHELGVEADGPDGLGEELEGFED
jgi:hypothetical protein